MASCRVFVVHRLDIVGLNAAEHFSKDAQLLDGSAGLGLFGLRAGLHGALGIMPAPTKMPSAS